MLPLARPSPRLPVTAAYRFQSQADSDASQVPALPWNHAHRRTALTSPIAPSLPTRAGQVRCMNTQTPASNPSHATACLRRLRPEQLSPSATAPTRLSSGPTERVGLSLARLSAYSETPQSPAAKPPDQLNFKQFHKAAAPGKAASFKSLYPNRPPDLRHCMRSAMSGPHTALRLHGSHTPFVAGGNHSVAPTSRVWRGEI